MKKYSSLFLAVCIVFLTSCSGNGKKVFVMASGKIQVNGNTINLQPGTTHNEVTVDPDSDSIIVTSPSGNQGYAVKEAGFYLLNLKKDTIVGSYLRTGTDNSQQVISQENLWQRVDSLTQLMKGQNVSAERRNYNLPPFSIAKITDNTKAQIIGPFRKVPGSFDPALDHEVYKFYTNKEVAEIVENVKKMMAN